MAIAVFTDVHADLPALQSVLNGIDDAGIDRVWCLGDFCSGGPDPAACFDLVTERCEHVLAGNHEAFVYSPLILKLDGGWAAAARFANSELGTGRIRALRKLRSGLKLVSDDAPDVTLVHGSMTNPESGHIRHRAEADETFRLLEADVLLHGHTHVPGIWTLTAGRSVLRPVAIGETYTLDTPVLLNPGAGCDKQGARWLEWRPAAGEAIWHQTDVPGHGGRWTAPLR